MAFLKRRTYGSEEHYEGLPLAAVSITKDRICYWASGYITNASAASALTNVLGGVNVETVDNSGGVAGDLEVQVCVTRDMVYEADTAGTPAQSQMGTNVTIDDLATVDEDDPITTANNNTAIIKLLRLLDANNKKVECLLNFFAPREDS